MSAPMATISKQYEYERNGHKLIIKRNYTIKGVIAAKQKELDDYFKEHDEELKTNTKSLQKLYNEHKQNWINNISFSMFYQKYKSIYGLRRS